MKTLVILFFLVIGTQANAQTEFTEVARMFNEGTALVNESMLGVYAGRCFEKDINESNKTVYSDALQAMFKATPYPGDDAGPAFPNKRRNIVKLLTLPVMPGWLFDDFTASDFDIKVYDRYPTSNSPTESDGKTLTWTMERNSGTDLYKAAARHYNNYIVMLITLTKFEDKPLLPPSEFITACYFYKKLP